MTKEPKVYLFWDNSNIFHSAQNVAATKEGHSARFSVRISFEGIYRLAVGHRNIAKAVAVGSIPPDQQQLWDRLKHDTKVDIELYERGNFSQTEQGVDQCLQTHMLRALADEADTPQIAILLTGDGKGYDEGIGFYADLERMHKKGWGIEVISWDVSCKRVLKEWAQNNGIFVRLEDYYDSVTFLEGTRPAAPLNLTKRKFSTPNQPESKDLLARKLELAEKELRQMKYGSKFSHRTPKKNRKRKRGY